MTDGKKIEPKLIDPKKDSDESLRISRLIDQKKAEAGYHETSLNRINDLNTLLNRTEFKGDQAIVVADCFMWLRSVKQNVKTAKGICESEIETYDKKLAEVQNADRN